MSYKGVPKKDQENNENKTSYAKYDFDTVCAGILFLIKNPDHLENLKAHLNPDEFFSGYDGMNYQALRQIIKTVNEVRKDHGIGKISEIAIEGYLAQTPDGDVYMAARQLYLAMRSEKKYRERAEDMACMGIFLDFLKANATMKWAGEFSQSWKQGDMTNATKRMKDLVATTDAIKFDSVADSVDVAKLSIDALLGFLAVDNGLSGDIFLLGCKKLDEDIGGFERRALHVFAGPTNSGKSMMSQHLLKRCIEQKLHAHIAVVEDRPKSFLRRLIASISGVHIKRLANRDRITYSAEETALILDAKMKIERYIKIDFAYGDSLDTIQRRKRDYDGELLSRGLKPYDVDIVDYTGHIADKSSGEKTYEKYRNAFAERKNFALTRNKIAFDFAQLNREGFKKRDNAVKANHGDLAGSYDLSQVCDNIIILNRLPEDVEKGDVRLTPTKVKDGAVPVDGYAVGVDFACARWDMNKYSGEAVTSAETTLPVKEGAYDDTAGL